MVKARGPARHRPRRPGPDARHRRAAVLRPGRRARDPPRLARGCSTPTRASGSASPRRGRPPRERLARYVRPDELHQAFNFHFLTAALERGRLARGDRGVAGDGRAGRRAQRPGCCPTTTSSGTSPGTAAASSACAARARRPCSRWPCPARPTSTRARSSACPRSSTCRRSSCATRSGCATPTAAGTAAGCRSRGPTSEPPFGFSPPGIEEPGCRCPRPGARSASSPSSRDPASTLHLYREALRISREHPALRRRPRWPGWTRPRARWPSAGATISSARSTSTGEPVELPAARADPAGQRGAGARGDGPARDDRRRRLVRLAPDSAVWWERDDANGPFGNGTARLADIAAQAGVSEATVSRVLNGKPGVSAVDPAGRAGRARRHGLRAPAAAAPAQQRADRPGHPGAGQPDLPGLRPGLREGADPARLHPAALHPAARRRRSRTSSPSCCGARGERHHLRLRAARRHHRALGPLHPADRPGRADRPAQRARGRRPGPVHLTGRPGGGAAGRTASGGSGARADRAGGRARAGSCR